MCTYYANGTATTFADKTVVLRDGIIEQVGTQVDLYERTDNTFVAQSIGSPKMNLFTSEDWTEKGKSFLPDAYTLLGMRLKSISLVRDLVAANDV